jgi:DNA-binding CsgD family transcriptional regulator
MNPWYLSEREAEVLSLVAELGCSKSVSRVAGIEPKTVDLHMAKVISKMGAKNRLQAAIKWDRWVGRTPLPELDPNERERVNTALLGKIIPNTPCVP